MAQTQTAKFFFLNMWVCSCAVRDGSRGFSGSLVLVREGGDPASPVKLGSFIQMWFERDEEI